MKTTAPIPAVAEACSADCQSAVSPIANRPDLTDKIARLPKVTRDMLNVMLDDSLPYQPTFEALLRAQCSVRQIQTIGRENAFHRWS